MGTETGIYSGERCVDYPSLLGRVARGARGLAQEGVGAGDRVAIVLRNEPAFLEASLAVATLGASPVPINWHFRAEEVGYILRDCSAKAVVAHEDLLPAIASAIPAGVTVIAVPTPPELAAIYGAPPADLELPAGAHRYEDWLTAHEPWDQPPPDATEKSVIYTSGTTGRPKGVLRDPMSDELRAQMLPVLMRVLGVDPEARTVIPAPLYHTAPNAQALAAAAAGQYMVIMPRFEPEEFLAIIERHRITHIQMVPTMFVRLLQLPEEVRERYDTSSLQYIVHAAAPCPPDVKQAMIDWWGPIINEYYGGTETGCCTYCTSEEALAHPGTIGRALPEATVKVLGDDGELPRGEIGELHMKLGPWPQFTYLGDPDKRASIEREGLISCGDIGYMDEDGYVFLCDRRSDMVISGGVNIYPAEIEACLLQLDGVRDCAIFGVPDEQFGEALAAHVEADPDAGLTEDAVRDHIGAQMARYKVPKVVVFDDALPREDSGKIFKRRLREPYWQGRERMI